MNVLYLLLNILQALFLVVWSMVWISGAILARLITGNAEISLKMARGYSPTLIRLTGAKFVVEPLPQIDWKQPHIYAMNHQSMLDIPCVIAALPVNLRFIGKHSLKWVPFIGWYMWATGMIFINRTDRPSAVKSMSEAARRVREGANIIVYPEGTRSRDGALLPFKKGPFILAIEAGVPIVPIAIEGSARVLPSDGFKVRPGLVRVKVGEPIATAGMTQDDRDTLMQKVRGALEQLHREIS